jgi:uncharacterized protein (DUF2062 family)
MTDPLPPRQLPNPVERLRRWLDRRVAAPLLYLLRHGASPEKLAWSLAVGVACGINPLLGSTTLVCLAVAAPLRLNLIAAQISNHLCYPLELALFFVFIRLGDRLFGTPHLKLGREALLHAFHDHPWTTTQALWTWEWHALIVWLLASLILTPVLALCLMPLLRHVAARRASAPMAGVS